ncbi:hypothetical protein KY284_008177 [Solanum tuberosum]|nr:hypothetical protein KY284_008177 [Solanum tuberosum]
MEHQYHLANGSTSSYQWIINEASSSYQWSINIILPMDQHNPTNGSSMKNYHPIDRASTSSPRRTSTSSHRWIINHYPINGASTSSS